MTLTYNAVVVGAGDGAGIGGAALASIEGKLACVAAAHYLGTVSDKVYERLYRRYNGPLAREKRFASALGMLYALQPASLSLATDDTHICRCERVRLREIQDAIAVGASTVNEVKGLTRAGMGFCQGRMCGELVAHAIAAALPFATYDDVAAHTARMPLHPIPLGDLVTRSS